jgi:2-dehydropantoate 2-reductase
MRILVVGAGATGGYFGARLAQAGRDVSFLVRPARAARLAQAGLVIRSPLGDVTIERPKTVLASALRDDFDLVLLSCKAYDLQAAMESFAPGMGHEAVVLPVLNGMSHLEFLDTRFGAERVLGGLCVISAALDDDGTIRHLNHRHRLVFGARRETKAGVVGRVASALDGAGFEARASDNIEHEMWEKWVMLATLAGATCLMRGSIGDILESPGGEALILGLLDECSATAQQQGHAPSPSALERIRSMLTTPRSPLTASMLRDIERGAPIEADHVLGDLLRRADEQNARSAGNTSILRIACAHLKVYEARRARGLPTG